MDFFLSNLTFASAELFSSFSSRSLRLLVVVILLLRLLGVIKVTIQCNGDTYFDKCRVDYPRVKAGVKQTCPIEYLLL